MVEVELKKQVKLNDLKIGNIFDDVELIIERNGNNMTTIRNDTGIEYGKEYNIRVYMYNLNLNNDDKVISINNNGYVEIFDNDKFHQEYKMKLKQNNLWFEN